MPSQVNGLKPAEDYTYNRGELICFYAQLAEPAEVDTIEKLWNPSAKDGYVFKCVRDTSGNLAGLMRAWKDDTRIIIYEIAVALDKRHLGVGKKLRDAAGAEMSRAAKASEAAKPAPAGDLAQTQGGAAAAPSPALAADQVTAKLTAFGNPHRLTTYLDRELAVIRTLYAISFIVGFQKIGEAVYFLFFQEHSHLSFSGALFGLVGLIMLALVLLGFRFFWAVGNIRRFVFRKISILQPPKRKTLMLHIALLFVVPLLFYFLCRIFQDLVNSLSLAQFNKRFLLVYGILLMANSGWLVLLTHKLSRNPERFWMINNFLFGIAALGGVVAASFGHYELTIAYTSCLLLLANSLIDLLFSSEVYFLGDAYAGG
jgi:hypothetical protein